MILGIAMKEGYDAFHRAARPVDSAPYAPYETDAGTFRVAGFSTQIFQTLEAAEIFAGELNEDWAAGWEEAEADAMEDAQHDHHNPIY